MAHYHFFTLAILSTTLVWSQPLRAQPPGQDSAQTEPQATQNADRQHVYPSIRLTYYAGREGAGWKESRLFELDQWTPQKDIVITAKWIAPSGATSPGARSSSGQRFDPFRRQHAYRPTRRAWTVEYVDAVSEGESHIFVNAPCLPKFSARIYGADDVIAFHHFPNIGWRQLGKAARAFKYRNVPRESTQDPLDTRSR